MVEAELEPVESLLSASLAQRASLLEQGHGESPYYHSIHVVNFDVDEGHCLEWSSSGPALTAGEASVLSMSAMPDSQP